MPATYEPIANYTVSGSSTYGYTFTNIPQTYTDIVYVINPTGSASVNYTVRFNNDSGNNYSFTQLRGDGSSASSSRDSNIAVGLIGAAGNVAAIKGNIFNYSNTTTYKTLIGRGGNAGTSTDAVVSLWRSTAAITSITFYSDASGIYVPYPSGTTIAIYGIKSAA